MPGARNWLGKPSSASASASALAHASRPLGAVLDEQQNHEPGYAPSTSRSQYRSRAGGRFDVRRLHQGAPPRSARG
jgi:hypothetical protein